MATFGTMQKYSMGNLECIFEIRKFAKAISPVAFAFRSWPLNGRGGGGSRLQETAVGFIYT